MKKIICSLIFLFLLTSCFFARDSRISDMENMIWKEEKFKLEATSYQLKNQFKEEKSLDYYSKITVDGKEYPCELSYNNSLYCLYLVDKE